MKVGIIVIHFGNIEITHRCLASIENSDFPKSKIKIIFINNDINQKIDATHLENYSLDILVKNNDKNLGFSKAVNLAISLLLKDSDISDILLLNNDTRLEKNVLKSLIANSIDIVSPVIRFAWDHTIKYDFGGKINYWTGRTTHIESTNRNFVSNEGIDYVSGCCMRLKRGVIEKVGKFDERFFFYFEDVDYCIRAKQMGFSIEVDRSVFIDHMLSYSVGRWSIRSIHYNLFSNLKFIDKHLGVRKVFGFIYLLMLLVKILINKLLNR